MSKITAIVYNDIPAHRLAALKGAGSDPDLDSNKIYIKAAELDTDPDFMVTKDLKAGDEVIVNIKGNPIWKAELAKDTRPGTLVSVNGDGKIATTNTRDHKRYIGFSIEGGKAGDVISYARKTGILSQALDVDIEGMTYSGEDD